MIEIDISINGEREFKQAVDDLALNQVPFALAKSLTRTAQNRQKAVQDALGDGRFILRQPAFLRAGVRIEPATKANLVARIKDIDWFMVLQETGGTKLPRYGEFIAVPLSGARPTPQSKIADSDLPAAVMKSGNGFIRPNQQGVPIMYRIVLKAGRRGKLARGIAGISKAAAWERQVLPMYALVKQAHITAVFGFKDTVMNGVEAIFRDNFAREFEEAKRTARLK